MSVSLSGGGGGIATSIHPPPPPIPIHILYSYKDTTVTLNNRVQHIRPPTTALGYIEYIYN